MQNRYPSNIMERLLRRVPKCAGFGTNSYQSPRRRFVLHQKNMEKYFDGSKKDTNGAKAAYYFTSWMFHYQPHYGENDEINLYGVSIRGLTSVSTQHHHLDMYAGIVVPYLRRLADYTNDTSWRTRADLMWNAVLQLIGDGKQKIHGLVRPAGSQNEAIFHCNWVFKQAKRGDLNDWLVAWSCAFRLSVLAEEL